MVDIVGALSAMGVFDMGAPTDQTDPTLSNFMPTFDALDADAQALVLANANPLDLSSMTAVTNAVDAIESLNDVISGVDTTTSIADAISDVRDMMEDDVLGSKPLRLLVTSWVVLVLVLLLLPMVSKLRQ